MKPVLLLILLSVGALAQPTIQIQRTITGPSQVMVRVSGGAERQQFWIERSDNSGKTWDEYVRAYNDEWYYVSTKATNSWFRAKEMR